MATKEDDPPIRRYARIAPLYKALIWTSFLINAILIIIVAVLGWTIFSERNQIQSLRTSAQVFAGDNVSELQDVVSKLQTSTISYTVKLRDARLPIELQVPINQGTVVTLTENVPLSVPAAILFPAGGGNLNASVNIQLPAGLRLPIALQFAVPLQASVPVNLDVPVNIPLAETELGPQFKRLGAVVDRLVAPAAPLLTFPDVPPDSSKADATPTIEPTLDPAIPTVAPLMPLPSAGPAEPPASPGSPDVQPTGAAGP